MPVLTVRCPRCAAEFVDSRGKLEPGDEVRCPSCGASQEFSREYVDASREGASEAQRSNASVHVEPEFKKP